MDWRREKVSKYFCNLEKRHYTSKIIRKIEKQDGTIVTEQDDIVKETSIYTNKKSKLVVLISKKLSQNRRAFQN